MINGLNVDDQVDQHNHLIFFNFLVNHLGDDFYKCNYRDGNGHYWNVLDAIAAKISPEKLRSRSETPAREQFYCKFRSAQTAKLLLLFSPSKQYRGYLFKDQGICFTSEWNSEIY